MPVSLPNLFRGAIMLVLGAHVFIMYSIARTMGETVGLNGGTATVAALFALVMLIPLVWAVALPEFPEMYLRHMRARRWYQQGRCPDCGYPTTATLSDHCSECGVTLRPPQPYSVGWHTVRLFIIINLLAWLLGSAAAESWVLADEHSFQQEAIAYIERGGVGVYQRDRAWPNRSARLIYDREDGVTAAK
jgi:hypothetical protein